MGKQGGERYVQQMVVWKWCIVKWCLENMTKDKAYTVFINSQTHSYAYSQQCSWRSNQGVWWLWAGKTSCTPPWHKPTQQRCWMPKVVNVETGVQKPTEPGRLSSSEKPVKVDILMFYLYFKIWWVEWVEFTFTSGLYTQTYLNIFTHYLHTHTCTDQTSYLLQWHPNDARGNDFEAVELQQSPAQLLNLVESHQSLKDEQGCSVHNHKPLVLLNAGTSFWRDGTKHREGIWTSSL